MTSLTISLLLELVSPALADEMAPVRIDHVAQAGTGVIGEDTSIAWGNNEDGRAHVFLGPDPDYVDSLRAQYTADAGVTVCALTRPDCGDPENVSLPATVWVTDTLGVGAHTLRVRWVIDGEAQVWLPAAEVAVTSRALDTAKTIDPFGDGRLTLTLDRTYPVGQFANGEWYVVAPDGLVIRSSFPATQPVQGKTWHGVTVDIGNGNQGLDGRGNGFNPSMVYDHAKIIRPGSVVVKAKSYRGVNNHIEHLITLTVVRERPPAGSLRPPVHEAGIRELRNVAEIDLRRVPRVRFEDATFPAVEQIRQIRQERIQRPAPPLGSRSTGARVLYPGGQSSTYHQYQRAMYAWPAYIIMAENLEDEAERMRMAVAMVQREIDILGSHLSALVNKSGRAYHWVAPITFAGTLLREPLLRGADRLGIAPGDYNFDGEGGVGGRWQYTSWNEFEAFAKLPPEEKQRIGGGRGGHRDLTKAGSVEELKQAPGTEVWEGLLEPRRVTYAPKSAAEAADLEAMGITRNGDGTWTVPARRFSEGGRYMWAGTGGLCGETRLLPPCPGVVSLNGKHAAWADAHNNQPKNDTYVAQHAGQAAAMAPLLKAVAGEDYLARTKSRFAGDTAWELYAGYALQWTRFRPDWMVANGFVDRQPGASSHWWQRVNLDGFPSKFVETGYIERWDDFVPTITPTKPDPATRQMFRLIRGRGTCTVVVEDLPHDGWAPITELQVRINGGSWIQIDALKPGDRWTTPLPREETQVAIRAMNRYGTGPPSGPKAVPAAE